LQIFRQLKKKTQVAWKKIIILPTEWTRMCTANVKKFWFNYERQRGTEKAFQVFVEIGKNVLDSRVARFFVVKTYQNGKIYLYQTAINYIKWPLNFPNGHKIYQPLSLQGPPNFNQNGIFGLKTYQLATL
jgi:hypothetical protein